MSFITSTPHYIDFRLQIELESLKNESDVMSVERRTKVEAQLNRKKRKAENLSALWHAGAYMLYKDTKS